MILNNNNNNNQGVFLELLVAAKNLISSINHQRQTWNNLVSECPITNPLWAYGGHEFSNEPPHRSPHLEHGDENTRRHRDGACNHTPEKLQQESINIKLLESKYSKLPLREERVATTRFLNTLIWC